jgi:hypothetical protein
MAWGRPTVRAYWDATSLGVGPDRKSARVSCRETRRLGRLLSFRSESGFADPLTEVESTTNGTILDHSIPKNDVHPIRAVLVSLSPGGVRVNTHLRRKTPCEALFFWLSSQRDSMYMACEPSVWLSTWDCGFCDLAGQPGGVAGVTHRHSHRRGHRYLSPRRSAPSRSSFGDTRYQTTVAGWVSLLVVHVSTSGTGRTMTSPRP